MRIVLTLFLLMLMGLGALAQIYTSNETILSFFSEAPLENIQATSKKGVSALNTRTGALYFKVKIRSFEFEKSLMQTHFNENYLESAKYPNAEFKGVVKEKLDYNIPGIYPVTVTGMLKIHNVSKPYTVKAVLEVRDTGIIGRSVFLIRLEDHHIKIPRLLFENIAEVIELRINAKYEVRDK